MALSARNWMLAGCMAVLSTGAHAAGAAAAIDEAPGATAQPLFDLPSLPLKEALARYDASTSLSVFFPSALVEGRQAAEVRGRFSPQEALHRLLEGTGLQARTVALDSFVLLPRPPSDIGEPLPQAAMPAQADPARTYGEWLQLRLLQALCTHDGLALGSYRLALRIRLDARGKVTQARLLDTTGDRRRDAAIVASVERVDVGWAPPDPSRPFVVLMRPQPVDAAPVCAGTGPRLPEQASP